MWPHVYLLRDRGNACGWELCLAQLRKRLRTHVPMKPISEQKGTFPMPAYAHFDQSRTTRVLFSPRIRRQCVPCFPCPPNHFPRSGVATRSYALLLRGAQLALASKSAKYYIFSYSKKFIRSFSRPVVCEILALDISPPCSQYEVCTELSGIYRSEAIFPIMPQIYQYYIRTSCSKWDSTD
jgi:hypothetical protein